MVVLMLAVAGAAADTEIHRCLLADGTIAFQETPCPAPAAPVDNDSDAAEPTLPEPPSQGRAECEKTMRDAIDAIDLEMRGNAYTREEGQEYLAQLLALTKRLRACKQL